MDSALAMVKSLASEFSPATHPTMQSDLVHVKEAQHILRRTTRWLLSCPDELVPDAYLEVMRAAEQLFGLEHQLMERYGFPVRQQHLEQHARVLGGLHCVYCEVMRGGADRGRLAGGQLLMEWLQLHNETLDAVLDVWVDCCSHGMPDQRNPPGGYQITAH